MQDMNSLWLRYGAAGREMKMKPKAVFKQGGQTIEHMFVSISEFQCIEVFLVPQ
jgi:hypothetical protein